MVIQRLPADISIAILLQMDLPLYKIAKNTKLSIVEVIALIYLIVPIQRWVLHSSSVESPHPEISL